jgi:anti-anti-sigma factor
MGTTVEASTPAPVNASPEAPAQQKVPLVATIFDLDFGVIVRVEGEAGVDGIDKLGLALARVIARRTPLAILDLAELIFLSSLAMGQLVRLSRDLARWGGRVKIASCRPLIREALETARLATFFEFTCSVEEAIPTA